MRTQLETLDYLISESDPEKAAHGELENIRAKVIDGQAISGRDRKFIRECLTAIDEIECRGIHPTRDGVCREGTKLRRCEYQGRLDECPCYERAGAERRRFGN